MSSSARTRTSTARGSRPAASSPPALRLNPGARLGAGARPPRSAPSCNQHRAGRLDRDLDRVGRRSSSDLCPDRPGAASRRATGDGKCRMREDQSMFLGWRRVLRHLRRPPSHEPSSSRARSATTQQSNRSRSPSTAARRLSSIARASSSRRRSAWSTWRRATTSGCRRGSRPSPPTAGPACSRAYAPASTRSFATATVEGFDEPNILTVKVTVLR